MGHLKSYLLSHHPAHSVNRCGAMPFPTVEVVQSFRCLFFRIAALRDQAEKTLNSTPV